MESKVTRLEAKPRNFSLLKDMMVERGSMSDWDQLHALHYKNEGKPIGPHIYRCVYGRMLVGVCILSTPKLLLGPRHEALPKLKPGNDTEITNKWRAQWINQNICVNSRTVVDTMFRGTGIAYRMLNLASRMEGKTFVEIQSSMSKFNPFAMQAGFRFTKPRSAAAYEKGLEFFNRHFRSHPGDQEAVLEELNAMPSRLQEKTTEAMREFYYKHSAMEKTGSNLNAGTSKVDSMPPEELLKNIGQLVFASPMYGLYRNPDAGRKLARRIPLLAFDNQSVDQPLKDFKCL